MRNAATSAAATDVEDARKSRRVGLSSAEAFRTVALARLQDAVHGATVPSPTAASTLVEDALLWLRPEPVETDSFEEESDELRAFPSVHTCLVANVVVPVDLMTHGSISRYARRGAIPAVYLSCAANFDRDDESGEIFSYEVAVAAHQERCAAEAEAHAEVRFCLDPACGPDWLSYFRREFALQRMFEVWQGDRFVQNRASAPAKKRGVQAYPVYGLVRSSLRDFEARVRHGAQNSRGARVGSRRSYRGGCVVAFRHEPPEAEPFGMWFLWLLLGGARADSAADSAHDGSSGGGIESGSSGGAHLVIVDLQNGRQARSLEGAIATLGWESTPRDEIFFAPFK